MARPFQPNQKILRRFANVFYDSGSPTKTQLYLASRLRWDSFLIYLEWLQSNGYVIGATSMDIKTFVLTETGSQFFQTIIKLFEMIK